MAMVPSVFLNRAQLAKAIDDAILNLGSDVVRVNYNFAPDSGGDPSIFFRVVLSDEASREHLLAEVTNRIIETMFEKIRPLEDWGLFPYFTFRSKSEQATIRNDPEWD